MRAQDQLDGYLVSTFAANARKHFNSGKFQRIFSKVSLGNLPG